MAGFGGLQCLIQVVIILIALPCLYSTRLDSTDCPEMCSCDVRAGVMDCSNRNISHVPSPIDSWVKVLRLEGNPLVCGCSTVRLYEALPQDTLQGAVCTNLHNTPLSDVATHYPDLCTAHDHTHDDTEADQQALQGPVDPQQHRPQPLQQSTKPWVDSHTNHPSSRPPATPHSDLDTLLVAEPSGETAQLNSPDFTKQDYVIWLHQLLPWHLDYGNPLSQKYQELERKVLRELTEVFTERPPSNYTLALHANFSEWDTVGIKTELNMSCTLPNETSKLWYRDVIQLLIRRAATTGRFSFGMDIKELWIYAAGFEFCKAHIPTKTHKGLVWGWSSKLPGNTSTAPCPENSEENATVTCKEKEEWYPENMSQCNTPSTRTTGLEELSLKPITNDSISTIAGELTVRTQHISNFTHREVSLTADVIQQCVAAPNAPVDEANGAELLLSVNRMLAVDINTLVEAERKSKASTRLVKWGVERLGNKMEGTTDGVKIAEPEIGVLVTKPSNGTGLLFEAIGKLEENITKEQMRVSNRGPDVTGLFESVHLPLSVVQQGDNENIHFAVYNSPIFFMVSEMANHRKQGNILREDSSLYVLNSRVVSAKVGRLDLMALNDSVTITLRHQTKNSTKHLCVYWDFPLAGWSPEGCEVTFSSNAATTCQCNHLSHFTLLRDIYGDTYQGYEYDIQMILSLPWDNYYKIVRTDQYKYLSTNVTNELKDVFTEHPATNCSLSSGLFMNSSQGINTTLSMYCALPPGTSEAEFGDQIYLLIQRAASAEKLSFGISQFSIDGQSDYCSAGMIPTKTDKGLIWFYSQMPNHTANAPCRQNPDQIATRRCIVDGNGQAQWEKWNTSQCQTHSDRTMGLEDLSERPVTNETMASTTGDLANLTQNVTDFTFYEVSLVADVIQKCLKDPHVLVTEDTGAELLVSVNKMLSVDFNTLVKSERTSNSSTRLLQSMERLGNKMEGTTNGVKIAESQIGLLVTKPSMGKGLLFEIGGDMGDDLNTEQMWVGNGIDLLGNTTAVHLPLSVVQQGENENIHFAVYNSPSFFMVSEMANHRKQGNMQREDSSLYVLNSQVVSAKVGRLDLMALNDSATITLRHINKNSTEHLCVYWDFPLAAWSPEGCEVTLSSNATTTCQCNHLSHFTLLRDIYGGTYLGYEYDIQMILLLPWDNDYKLVRTDKYKYLSTKVTTELKDVFTEQPAMTSSLSSGRFVNSPKGINTTLSMYCPLPLGTSKAEFGDKIYMLIRRAASEEGLSFGISQFSIDGEGDYCSAGMIPTNTDEGLIWFYSQMPNHTASAPCPENPDQTATRRCIVDDNGQAQWEIWNTSLCQTPSNRTKGLEDLSERPVTNETIASITQELANLTQDVTDSTSRDVSLVADVIRNCLTAPNVLLTEDTGAELLVSVNKMLSVDFNTLVESQRNSNSSTRLLQYMERLGNKMKGTTDGVKIAESHIGLLVTKPSMGEGLLFEIDGDMGDDLNAKRMWVSPGIDLSGNTTAVYLPWSVVQQGDNENIHFAVYNSPNFFMASKMANQDKRVGISEENSHVLNSQVVSAKVGNMNLRKLNDSVTITLRHEIKNSSKHLCVYWDFALAGWSTEGCYMTSSTSDITRCECNHLTNFALLMDIYGGKDLPDIHKEILSILSIIGCVVSAAGLILTLLTYFTFRKLLKDNPSKILVNLCAALLGIIVAFTLTSQRFVRDNLIACKALAALTHYFVLAAMAWMLVEAFYMYMALVRVFHTGFSKLLLKFCLIGWGLPLIVVGITAGSSMSNYGVQGEICWLSQTPFMAAVMAPVALTIILNGAAFGLVLHRLHKMNKLNMQKSKCSTTKSRLLGAAGIMVLLGLTWIFAFFAIGEVRVVFHYLFVISNSLQGLFIFIFHCLRNPDAKHAWMGCLGCSRSSSQAPSSSRGVSTCSTQMLAIESRSRTSRTSE